MLSQATRVSLSYAPGRSTCLALTEPASWHDDSVAAMQPTRSLPTSGRTQPPATVPATTTSTAPDVASFTIGELAVAIHAAGIPRGFRALGLDEVRDLAVRGAALLGLAEIQRRDRASKNAVMCSAWADYDLLWGSSRRAQAAHDLAWRMDGIRHDKLRKPCGCVGEGCSYWCECKACRDLSDQLGSMMVQMERS